MPVLGDRDMLERVVVNLVGNAVKFTPDGGQVDVRLDVDGDHASLSVSDTGIGIPADEQERLFTRFFRSSLAIKAEVPGSGLGLSIATRSSRSTAAPWASSRPRPGSTFRVTLAVVG